MKSSRKTTFSFHYLFLLLVLVFSGFPVSFETAQASSQQNFSQDFTASGSFTVPAGVTSVTVELVGGGGGGGGGGGSNRYGGGGGAGGQYVRKNSLTVTPGNSYSVVIGNGGSVTAQATGTAGGSSYFQDLSTVVAQGGAPGYAYSNGKAGGVGNTAYGVGDVVYPGGNGANGATTYSGGGGSGGGSSSSGSSGSSSTGGAAKASFGGAGGKGTTANSAAGSQGGTYGGGGGGATKTGLPGRGGAGFARISWTETIYDLTYTAGSNGTLSGTTSQTASYGGNGTAVTANPNPGFYFVKWSDGVGQNPRTDTNVSASKNVSAEFDVIGSTKSRMTTNATQKIVASSMGKGMVADLPLKSKYTKSTAVAGSEILTDRTPYSNDGQNYGAVLSATGTTFDGVNDYINLGNPDKLKISGAITLSAWVKPTSVAGLGNIISKNGNSGFRYRVNAANQLWFYVSGNSVTGGTVPLNVWSHVVAVGDASGLKIYVNGVNVGSNSTPFAPADPNTGDVYIGQVSMNTEVFNGQIANVRIYSNALSASEVKSLYEKGLEGSTFILKGQN